MIIIHGNHSASVEFDSDIEMFVGKIITLSSPVTFMASDAAGLAWEFEASLDAYAKVCEERR